MSNILIIDDDDQLRKSFNKLLTDEGYRPKCAASGEAGLKIVQQEVLDLVILDMRLPGMNGLETFQAIHEMEPKLPVIIMTAFGTTETAIEATKMGAFDYILKPFDIPEMLVVIKQALEASRFMRSPVDMDPLPEKSFRDAIIGRSKSMQEAITGGLVLQGASNWQPVLQVPRKSGPWASTNPLTRRGIMKAGIVFTGSGPMVIMKSSLTKNRMGWFK
jgi:DNA-binding NtrC family response regulator